MHILPPAPLSKVVGEMGFLLLEKVLFTRPALVFFLSNRDFLPVIAFLFVFPEYFLFSKTGSFRPRRLLFPSKFFL